MIYLRELAKQDIPTINKWRNDKEIIESLTAPFRYVNLETDDSWFDSYKQNRNSQVRCSICLTEHSECIGLVSLTGIDPVQRKGDFSLMIGAKQYHDKGIGILATRIMLNHAFYNLNLHRIQLEVLEENLKAIRVYEKAGFSREGILRDAAFKNGRYVNMLVMGILKNEFSVK